MGFVFILIHSFLYIRSKYKNHVKDTRFIKGSNKEFSAHVKDFNFHKKILDITFVFVIATLIICFIAFLTFILDAYKLHYEREKEYIETVKELKHDNDNKMEMLEKRLIYLENCKNPPIPVPTWK